MESDPNPYFDASVAHPSGASATAEPFPTAASSPQQPEDQSTPAREEPPASLARNVFFRPLGDRQQSSIRLRQCPNPPHLDTIPSAGVAEQQSEDQQPSDRGLLRPLSHFRSGSRSRAGSTTVPLSRLPTIEDGVAQDFAPDTQLPQGSRPVAIRTGDGSMAPGALVPGQNGPRLVSRIGKNREYNSDIVDLLDVIGELLSA